MYFGKRIWVLGIRKKKSGGAFLLRSAPIFAGREKMGGKGKKVGGGEFFQCEGQNGKKRRILEFCFST